MINFSLKTGAKLYFVDFSCIGVMPGAQKGKERSMYIVHKSKLPHSYQCRVRTCALKNVLPLASFKVT